MTTTRCKFKLNSITRRKHWDAARGDLFDLAFSPVTGGSPENAAFYDASPCGEFKVSTVKQEIAEGMTLGGEFYIDITPAQ